jgi:hypothetical protein
MPSFYVVDVTRRENSVLPIPLGSFSHLPVLLYGCIWVLNLKVKTNRNLTSESSVYGNPDEVHA